MRFTTVRFIFLLIFLISIFSSFSYAYQGAENESTLAIADRQLHLDKKSQELVKKQFFDLKVAKNKQYTLLQESGVTTPILKHAELDFIAAQAAIEGANIALIDAKQASEDIDNSIHNQEKNLQNLILLTKDHSGNEVQIIALEANLEFLKRLQQIQNDRIKALNDIKSVTKQRLELENQWQQRLQILYSLQQRDQERNRLQEVIANLQEEQQNWLLKLSHLNQELQLLSRQGLMSDMNLKKFHFQIFEAEEYVALIRLKSYLVQIQNRLENLQDSKKIQKPSYQLSELVEQVANILSELASTEDFVSAKTRFLAMKNRELQDNYAYSQMLRNLFQNYQAENKFIINLKNTASSYHHQLKLQLQHHLSERQKFPQELAGWIQLSQKFFQIPYLLLTTVNHIVTQGIYETKDLHKGLVVLLLLTLPFLFVCWFYLRRFLRNLELIIRDDKRFSTKVVFFIIELLRRNLGTLLCCLLLLSLILILNIYILFVIYLLLVYLCFKLTLSVAKLILLENVQDNSGKDVALYYRIKWALVLGFILSTLAVMAHQLPVAYEAKILVSRLFMIFIFVLGLQLLKARFFIVNLFTDSIHVPRYFHHVLRLLSHVIPIALLFNAIIGLLGYVELALVVAKYQIILITILAGYLIARGILIDAMEFISEVFIKHVKQGWLWTEAILKPLDKILRIVLFLISMLYLLHFYQLDANEYFIHSIEQLLHKKLFTLGGNVINVLLLCELFIILALIKWVAYWSREFSFRWLYIKSKDVGVRNSLSIFTQYASVIFCVLIGLKFLGIDLKGFTVVAAAFAAGIGFGMRDLIINFFSGILLLIERPFRTGDIVSLGSYEGEVILTGMRSMTIRTWDYEEVIVPNADMFTKPFVNWTHHDNIVRTVIILKIHREDDPHQVQRLMLNVLKNHPNVAKDPLPEVILHEMSEVLIEMHVRYYILLTTERTKAGVKSEVLFTIWDCLKANNIRAPYPQYDLHLKNL